MASTVLDTASLQLMTNPAREVEIPHLMTAEPTLSWQGTSVRFAGDTYPTPFGGEGRSESWPLTARYGRHQQHLVVALIALVRDARASADQRLWLRTHYGLIADLDAACAVTVQELRVKPQVGLYVDVVFTCDRVQEDW